MACSTDRSAQIGDLASGRIGAEAAGEVLDHLEACPECSAEFDLCADLVAAADQAGPRLFAGRPRAALARRLPLAVAAAALLGLGLWISFADRGGSGRATLARLASTEPLQAAGFVLRSDAPEGARQAYREAMDRYAAGDFAGAAQRLALWTASSPDDALANLYLGICRLQTGSIADATAPLDRAAEKGEDLVRERGLWYLGNARLALGEAEAALATLERLAELGGDYEPNARAKVAAIRSALGK